MDDTQRTSDLVTLALAEDLGDGDITTHHFVDEATTASAQIVAREACIFAGSAVASQVFRRLSDSLTVRTLRADGQSLEIGDVAMGIEGRARDILSGERVALNFIQHLSGIATATRAFVDAIAGTRARILDTRKTCPGLRHLEKAAVLAGGGTNHRSGLFDMVLVKDNHLAACGGIAALQARLATIRRDHPHIKIEVEVDSIEQLAQLLPLQGIDRVLLDNMSLDDLRRAVAMRRPGLELEASGGITLSTAREIALTGVDFLSVGAITHSAPAIDFGLDF